MKFLELLNRLDNELSSGVAGQYWHIELYGDASGDLFEPVDDGEPALTSFNDINHLENILEALLEHKPRTSTERVSLILDIE